MITIGSDLVDNTEFKIQNVSVIQDVENDTLTIYGILKATEYKSAAESRTQPEVAADFLDANGLIRYYAVSSHEEDFWRSGNVVFHVSVDELSTYVNIDEIETIRLRPFFRQD